MVFNIAKQSKLKDLTEIVDNLITTVNNNEDELNKLKNIIKEQETIIKENKDKIRILQSNYLKLELKKRENIKLKTENEDNINIKLQYSEYDLKNIPAIKDVLKDSTLIRKNGTKVREYNMIDLINLKKDLENLNYTSITDFYQNYNTTRVTLKKLCAGIETKTYDPIFKKWEELNTEKIVTFDEFQPVTKPENFEKKFCEKYGNIMKYSERGICFDGFNFRIKTGYMSNTIICNIIVLKQILNNFDIIVKEAYHNIYNIVDEYKFKETIYAKRTLLTLIKTPTIFTHYLDYYNNNHKFRLNNNLLLIDNQFTGLRLSNLQDINATVENTNNLEKTITGLIRTFDNIKTKYIVLICLKLNELPSEWFKVDKNYPVIEGKDKRKSYGMI